MWWTCKTPKPSWRACKLDDGSRVDTPIVINAKFMKLGCLVALYMYTKQLLVSRVSESKLNCDLKSSYTCKDSKNEMCAWKGLLHSEGSCSQELPCEVWSAFSTSSLVH